MCCKIKVLWNKFLSFLFINNPTEYVTCSGIIIRKTLERIFNGKIIKVETIIPGNFTSSIIFPDEFKDFCCKYKMLTGQKSVPMSFYTEFGNFYEIKTNQITYS